jgi:hypothetical protein
MGPTIVAAFGVIDTVFDIQLGLGLDGMLPGLGSMSPIFRVEDRRPTPTDPFLECLPGEGPP